MQYTWGIRFTQRWDIIVKMNSKVTGCGLNSNGPGKGPMVRSCEHSFNGPLGSIKSGELAKWTNIIFSERYCTVKSDKNNYWSRRKLSQLSQIRIFISNPFHQIWQYMGKAVTSSHIISTSSFTIIFLLLLVEHYTTSAP